MRFNQFPTSFDEQVMIEADEQTKRQWDNMVERETCQRLGISVEDYQAVRTLVEQDRNVQLRFKLQHPCQHVFEERTGEDGDLVQQCVKCHHWYTHQTPAAPRDITRMPF